MFLSQSRIIHTVRESPVRYWLLVFLLLNVFLIQDGKTNVLARIGMMAAMLDGPSFQIDPRWTEDRAETPDGRIYANKGPGVAFVGLPVFWLIDQFVFPGTDILAPNEPLRPHYLGLLFGEQ